MTLLALDVESRECFSAAEKKEKHKQKALEQEMEKLDDISPIQQKALNYYATRTKSIEIVKGDCIQKVNFRVRNKVCLYASSFHQ